MRPGFVIPTRQKADSLFGSAVPISPGAAGAFTTPVAETDGYSQVSILAVSDQPFSIAVQESCSLPPPLGAGLFVQTAATIVSVPAPGGQQQVCTRVPPCGSFMKMTLTNTGAAKQAFLSFCVLGIPLP